MSACEPPLVSVLMPVLNAQATLRECLDSVAAQSLTRYELVVVDDGSTDATHALLAEHARVDPRIRVLSQPHAGIVAALNRGLDHCRAEVVARMDADDRMHPERLAAQLQGLGRWPWCAVLGARARLFPEPAVGAGMRAYMDWQNGCTRAADLAADIYLEAPIAHPTAAFRTELIRRAGGYRDGDFPEDYELWLRLHASGARFAKLRATLLAWRVHPGSASRRDPRYSRAAFDALRARYLARDPRLQTGRPLVVWGAGRRTRLRFRHLQRHGLSPVAWVDIDPRKLGWHVQGVPVVPPVWLRRRGRRPLVLVYVATHGARQQIAAFLDHAGYGRGADYLMIG